MLIAAKSMGDFSFRKLMEVYEASNQKAAQERKNLPAMFALQLAEQDFCQYLQDVFFKTPGAVYYIWENNGSYVSALRLEPYRNGLLLEALETAEAHRQKGYASKLIVEVISALKQHGPVTIRSSVDKENTQSLATHKKCGFVIDQENGINYLNGDRYENGYGMLYTEESEMKK